MIIDTHCHYNLSPIAENWFQHWHRAQDKGVVGSIVVGTSVQTSKKALEIAESEPNLFASAGIHPTECQNLESVELAIEQLSSMIYQAKIVAIGECGLDYYRLSNSSENNTTKVLQKKVLTEQLKLAQTSQLPLIIHLRDKTEQAYWDFLEIFKSVFPQPHPFVLHCVSGPQAFVQSCIDLGAYIGVAGNVTYPNSDHIRQLIASVPSERILVETDAPFLPPQESRGKTCEPWMIQWTVEYLKNTYGLQEDDLVKHTVSVFPQFLNIYETK